MKLAEIARCLDRTQRGLLFKIIASGVITVLALSYAGWYVVDAERRGDARFEFVEPSPEEEARVLADATSEEEAELAEMESAMKRWASGMNDLLSRKTSWASALVGTLIGWALIMAVIWLGHGLTGLALLILLSTVAGPMYLIGMSLPETVRFREKLMAASVFVSGVALLTFAFIVLVELLKISLSGPSRICAIARNVVNEAIRLKVSLIFIVMLLFGLAALPSLLNDDTPLRYRVQSFLQYGTGGAFWITAVLVLFLSVGTVAFEQRDRVIWQTITKPVASWEYLLGKWLGVVGLAAVLLTISASGVFLFTEYLRGQPAGGEVEAFIPENPNEQFTEDRFILETQVLSARQSVMAFVPSPDVAATRAELDRRVATAAASDPTWQNTYESRFALAEQLEEERRAAFFTIEYRALSDWYEFRGLGRARDLGRPVILRYKIQAGGNDPRNLYRLGFEFEQIRPFFRDVSLDYTTTQTLPANAINEDGVLRMKILNMGKPDAPQASMSVMLPPDGLTIFYEAGSYRPNFVRVIGVLWLKLAFLAMIGITAATFLNFHVASMVAFGAFFIAESSGFLANSLEYYSTTTREQDVIIYKAIVRAIAVPIAESFQFYSNLRPTTNLVDGRLVPMKTLAQAAVMLGTLTCVLYGIAVLIFRRRELATYSGH